MKVVLMFVVVSVAIIGCQQKKLEETSIRTASMVCGMCSKAIEKAVYSVEGVKEVNVDSKAKIVQVKFVSEQTNVQTLERAITDIGYDANDRKRDEAAYNDLDACCKTDL